MYRIIVNNLVMQIYPDDMLNEAMRMYRVWCARVEKEIHVIKDRKDFLIVRKQVILEQNGNVIKKNF